MADQLITQNFQLGAGSVRPNGFKAYAIDTSVNPSPSYNRRDFYKASLVTGHFVLQVAGRSLELNGTYLFFANPRIPYSTLLLSVHITGYACLFTEDFLQANNLFDSMQQDALFASGGIPAYRLTEGQAAYCTDIFHKMQEEQSTGYRFKNDLIRSYLQLLLHEAFRGQHNASFESPCYC
ncbi:hypothetical protein SAMN06265337_1246 [Hymenobacter gelipurpurascens]|uniref:AraC family transcriptional regulator n=1 Tax=Hymenobacter gelipurpurascens TaxID=89968 RepID=A0A212TGX8_9BACT|nr:hypothetical protein [Hymenobacter gelipurpurascens]SNC65253.1 hypothetical protein SAMN06265337_1246 [Hymenobacter gelipurpurascens]